MADEQEDIDQRLEFNIPSDESEDDGKDHNNGNDMLFNTEKLEEVVQVMSSHVTTEKSSSES